MAKKKWGPVVYYLKVSITDNSKGGNEREQRIGPFASFKEAEMKRAEQEEAVGQPGCEYEYSIIAEPWPPLDSK